MNKCLNCGKDVGNKFCNVSCQNLYKGKQDALEYYKNPKLCKKCGSILKYEKRQNNFCNQSCAVTFNNLARIPKVKEKRIRQKKEKITNISDKVLIKNNTKDKIFSLSKNWQSARSAIRKDAARNYKKSGKEYICEICGYDTYIEIAHIKAVSEFDDSATMEEINHITNLVALCPNHHWEYDHAIITL